MEAQQALPGLRSGERRRPFPLNLLAFSDRAAERLRWVARGWMSIRTPAFLALAFSEGIPHSAGQAIWEMPLQLGLLVLVDIGAVVTWRFKPAGATITTVGAVLLGVLAVMERQPLEGLAVAVAFMMPGVLYWLDWQRNQSVRSVLLLAAGFVMLIFVGGIAAFAIHGSLPGGSQFQMLWDTGVLR